LRAGAARPRPRPVGRAAPVPGQPDCPVARIGNARPRSRPASSGRPARTLGVAASRQDDAGDSVQEVRHPGRESFQSAQPACRPRGRRAGRAAHRRGRGFQAWATGQGTGSGPCGHGRSARQQTAAPGTQVNGRARESAAVAMDRPAIAPADLSRDGRTWRRSRTKTRPASAGSRRIDALRGTAGRSTPWPGRSGDGQATWTPRCRDT